MKKFLDGAPNRVSDHIEEMISDKDFTFANYDEAAAERVTWSDYSYWRSTFRVFFKNRTAVLLLILLAALLLFTFIQPHLPGQRPATLINNDPETGMTLFNVQPNEEFWFGTNSIGQDLWSMVWSGTRTSLIIGFTVALSEVVIGITVGVLWGYVRSLDHIMTALYNVLDNIPQTILLILISYILRPSMSTIILAMCLTSWLKMARFIRNQIVIIRDRDYNLASRCLGTPTYRIILRNLLPYLVSVMMLRIATTIPEAIGNEVFLTYIGLGLPVSIPSLGNLINTGRGMLMYQSLRYQLIFPAIVLSVVTVSFYIIGNAFADARRPPKIICKGGAQLWRNIRPTSSCRYRIWTLNSTSEAGSSMPSGASPWTCTKGKAWPL